ncbi:MAG: hypothetical protein HQL07_08575 [Nitrospirae bacterium]|nr:hypothetical protein [Magnetococcales bacterium]
MQSERDKLFEKLLSDSLRRVIDFVRYAEAKHLALLTFSSTWVVILIKIITEQSWSLAMLGSGTALLLFLISAGVALVSFVPRTNRTKFYSSGSKGIDAEIEKNLLFYGDLQQLAPGAAGSELEKHYTATGEHILSKKFVSDIGEQIVINSRIAAYKFRLFTIGLVFGFAGIAAILFFAIGLVMQ